jgi:coatomer subunit beta'
MMLAFNPRDPNTFCSGSLDRSIKIWSLNSAAPKANFTLNGHEQGVNCVDYYRGDKPYIISGADDRLVKIWDYQTKQCIHTLEGHENNVSAAIFHPEMPIIITGYNKYHFLKLISYTSCRRWHHSHLALTNL